MFKNLQFFAVIALSSSLIANEEHNELVAQQEDAAVEALEEEVRSLFEGELEETAQAEEEVQEEAAHE